MTRASPAFDGSGNLWVADAFNQRVLEYTPPFSNGMAASLELGQPSGDSIYLEYHQHQPERL